MKSPTVSGKRDETPAPDDPKTCIEALLERARERNWRTLELRGLVSDGQEVSPAEPSLSFLGHILKLVDDEQVLFDRLPSSVQRAIRKAERSGIHVEFSDSLESVRAFYMLHLRTRARHGLPPQPFRFFESIYRHVLQNGMGMVVLARLSEASPGETRGRPISGAFFLYTPGTAIYKFGASDLAYQQMRPNNLVMWKAILWLKEQGAKVLHFGRTSLHQEGLRRFKLGWGAQELRLRYFKFESATGRPVVQRDRGAGWYNEVFARMPAFMSRAVGGALYRHIA